VFQGLPRCGHRLSVVWPRAGRSRHCARREISPP